MISPRVTCPRVYRPNVLIESNVAVLIEFVYSKKLLLLYAKQFFVVSKSAVINSIINAMFDGFFNIDDELWIG